MTNDNLPELVRYRIWFDNNYNEIVDEDPEGEYVRYNQATAVIAAKDAEINELVQKNNDAVIAYHRALNQCSIEEERAEDAEAELAQYEAQEPVAELFQADDGEFLANIFIDDAKCFVGLKLYASPVPDADLKAENEKLREALKPFAELAGYYSDCSELDLPAEAIVPNIGDLFKARAALNVT